MRGLARISKPVPRQVPRSNIQGLPRGSQLHWTCFCDEPRRQACRRGVFTHSTTSRGDAKVDVSQRTDSKDMQHTRMRTPMGFGGCSAANSSPAHPRRPHARVVRRFGVCSSIIVSAVPSHQQEVVIPLWLCVGRAPVLLMLGAASITGYLGSSMMIPIACDDESIRRTPPPQ
jgi:hypothetical protein